MASKSKGNSVIVKLVSTAGTGCYYTVRVNKKNRQMKGQGKLVLKKYDKKLRKRVDFKEDKVK